MEVRNEGNENKGSSGSESAENRKSEKTGKGNTGNEGNETRGVENRKVSEINLVEIEEPEKKKRGRPKKSETTKKKEKKESVGLSVDDLSPLLVGGFSLASIKLGEHWNITPEEAETVAKPLQNILSKLEISDKLANMSDGAGLVMAITTIVLPRILATGMNKEKKQEKVFKENGVIENDFKKRKTDTDSRKDPRRNSSPNDGIYNAKTNLVPVSQ